MSNFHERLKLMARTWVQSGRNIDYLAPDLTAALASLWLDHHGAANSKLDNVSSLADPDGLLREYVDQSLEGVDVWSIWSRRAECHGCGETYKLENMITCTECRVSRCWRCEGRLGSDICRCGGEMY